MNWGTKIIIGMGLFMGFIATLVTFMIINNEKDALIEKDYYEKGLNYDLDYKAMQDARDDKVIPIITTNEKGTTITFPVAVAYEMLWRRLSDPNLDRKFKSDIPEEEVFIPLNDLKSGSWLLRIQYKTDEKNYLYQNKIMIP
jgi:hypothetical protein